MNIKRAKQEIKNAIAAYLDKDEYGEYRIPAIRQRPILLMGAPGIGKTQIMEQIAGECDLALVSYTITHHTRQSAIGLPFIQEKVYHGEKRSVTEYTMSEIIASVYDRMESSGKEEGILFIDEINCVSETLAPAMLQFLQGKSFGNQKVPKGWVIVAAGNPPEYNKSVREFDVVTLDRVKMIPVDPDFAVWKEYAYQAGIHGAIISYLDIHKENFYRMETTVDGKQFVTARGWEDLSELIYAYERLGIKVDRDVISQYLRQVKTAKDFTNFLELYYRYRADYQIDEILQGTIRPGTKNKLTYAPFDERLEVVGLLMTRLAENFRHSCEAEDDTDRVYAFMKQIREELTAAGEASESAATEGAGEDSGTSAAVAAGNGIRTPAQIIENLRIRKEEEQESRIKAGQNEKMLRTEYAHLLRTAEHYEQLMSHFEGTYDEAFEVLRKEFLKEAERKENTASAASEQLEYAFDFMEQVFGSGQEMVVFITELSVNTYASRFLQENDCDRYYMYNKNLLFEESEARLRMQLDELRDLQIT